MSTSMHLDEHLPSDVHELAAHVLGTHALAQEWLNRPALALDGRRPCELLTDPAGAQKVKDLLMRIEYSVYS